MNLPSTNTLGSDLSGITNVLCQAIFCQIRMVWCGNQCDTQINGLESPSIMQSAEFLDCGDAMQCIALRVLRHMVGPFLVCISCSSCC